MVEKGVYFVKSGLFELIKECGGVWNDFKERPMVCLLKSIIIDGLYYAIPLGNYEHRDAKAKLRIEYYLNLPDNRIESCYYHVGNTTTKSIFFISDVVPITDKYVDREYINYYSKKIYIIKNSKLIESLERKVMRILSWENGHPNYFRQHITDVQNVLINELKKNN